METDKINGLLDKYWAGETSLEEEDILRTYFASGSVDPALSAMQPLFSFYAEKKQVNMVGDVVFTPQVKPATPVHNLRWLINVAATVLVFVGLFFANRYQDSQAQNTYVYVDTYDDPEVAYQEVKEALRFISSKMNKGLAKADQSLNKMEPLDNILN